MRRLPYAVRQVCGGIVGGIPVRVRGGPNAGLKWSLASAGRGYMSGRFEADRVEAIVRLLRPGDSFWDVGAHKGFVTLAAARAVGPTGRVAAIEPAADNRAALLRHLRWNDASNVDVLPVALSGSDGERPFGGRGSSITYRIGGGDEVVPTRTVDSLVRSGRVRPPTVLKLDIEGSEAEALRGAADNLAPHMLVWISIHGRDLYHECRRTLRRHGFRIHESVAMERLSRDTALPWSGDRELLAVGPERGLTDADIGALALFGSEVPSQA